MRLESTIDTNLHPLPNKEFFFECRDGKNQICWRQVKLEDVIRDVIGAAINSWAFDFLLLHFLYHTYLIVTPLKFTLILQVLNGIKTKSQPQIGNDPLNMSRTIFLLFKRLRQSESIVQLQCLLSQSESIIKLHRLLCQSEAIVQLFHLPCQSESTIQLHRLLRQSESIV